MDGYTLGVRTVLGVSPLIFAALFALTAPYGRHARAGWGPAIPARLSWVLMESPAALWFPVLLAAGPHADAPAALALASMWMLHYTQRAFVYPALMRQPKAVPLSITAMGLIFNVPNATLNALALSHRAPYPDTWLGDPRFLAGTALFLAGFAINLHSDHVLRALRTPDRSGYSIPDRGLHRLVASPNYLGECLEWAGFALAAWNGAALAFAAFSIANLAPRAWAHRRWYRQTFAEYPAGRRALIPWLF